MRIHAMNECQHMLLRPEHVIFATTPNSIRSLCILTCVSILM